MHSHSIDQWTHEHVFLGKGHSKNERRTWFVVVYRARFFGHKFDLSDVLHVGLLPGKTGFARAA